MLSRNAVPGQAYRGKRSPVTASSPRRARFTAAVAAQPVPSDFVTSTETVLRLHGNTATVDADSVFKWFDGGGRNNFVSGRDAPTFTGDWLDGNVGITFDGTAKQVLRCGCFTGIGKGDKPCALIVASINADHPAGTPTLLYLAGKSPLTASYIVFNVNVGASTGSHATSRLGSGGTSSDAGIGGATWANGTPRLFMGVAANASDRAEIWVDNTLRGTAAAGASGGLFATPTHAVIGSGDEGGGATRWFDGTIGDVIVFRNKPTALELDALFDGYYAHYWPTIYAGLA